MFTSLEYEMIVGKSVYKLVSHFSVININFKFILSIIYYLYIIYFLPGGMVKSHT